MREAKRSTSVMVAGNKLKKGLGEAALGIQPAQDSKLKYESIRATLLNEYKIKGRATLVTKKDGTETIWGLPHLDTFFAGRSVSAITTDVLREFIAKQQARAPANA